MPYSHITYLGLRQQLALRLSDSSNIFWTDTENGIYITEALRTFGLLSGFWFQRGIFNTVANTAFYDITTQTAGSPTLKSLLGYTVTDRNLIQTIQFHLLENTTSQFSWNGTEMFTLTDVANALQNRRNQFLADTGVVVTRSLVSVSSPPIGRVVLADNIIDIRRAAWLGVSPVNYYNPLWRDDERVLTAADPGWSVNPGKPEEYSVMAPPPLTVQLAPVPIANGQMELLTVNTGANLTPSASATILGIPDDLTPAIKWGAMADLLGKDGIARDPVRSQYCEQMYQQFVQYARNIPVVIHAEIQGVPLIPVTLQELDSYDPNWENSSDTPSDMAVASTNLVALNPLPSSGNFSVTLDVVQKCPVPVLDGDFIQVGREQLDMILDYAEHLAAFKMHGMEWKATMRQADNFLKQSITYNQRITASVRASLSVGEQSQKEKFEIMRRDERGEGIGALRGSGNGRD